MRRDRSWSDCRTGNTGSRSCDLMRSGPHTLQRGSVRREAVRRPGIWCPQTKPGNRRGPSTRPEKSNPCPYQLPPRVFAFQQFCALCTTRHKIPKPNFGNQLNSKRSDPIPGRKIAKAEIRALRAGLATPPHKIPNHSCAWLGAPPPL